MARTPGYDPVRNARTAIVLSALDGNDPNGFNMANVSCAAENIILTATELGIGSRFAMGPVMSLSQEPLQSKLSLPEGYIPLVMLLLGNAEMPEEERLKTITNITYL